MINQIILLIVTVIVFSSPRPANATSPKPANNIIESPIPGEWNTHQGGTGKNIVCYISSAPTKKTGKYKRRGDTYLFVTHRPVEKEFDVFELRAGYKYKKDSTVIIDIDGQKFKLFTVNNTAWAKDSKTDSSLARAMIRGRKMTITGTSSRGTKTFDTYPLKGFTAAYNLSRKICGIG